MLIFGISCVSTCGITFRRTARLEFKIKLEIREAEVQIREAEFLIRQGVVDGQIVCGFNGQLGMIDSLIEPAADVAKMLDFCMHVPLEDEEAVEQTFCNGHAVECSSWGAFNVLGMLEQRRELFQDFKKAFDGL